MRIWVVEHQEATDTHGIVWTPFGYDNSVSTFLTRKEARAAAAKSPAVCRVVKWERAR